MALHEAATRIQAVLGRGVPAQRKFWGDIEAYREHAKNQLANLKIRQLLEVIFSILGLAWLLLPFA